MKQTIITLATLFFCLAGYCQDIKFIEKYNYRQMQRKAKLAQLPGILMVSVGGCLVLVSGPLLLSENPSNPDDPNLRKYKITGVIFAVTGIALCVSSIPFWIKGHRIMKEVKKIKIRMKSTTMTLPINNLRYVTTRQFGFSLSIPLGK